jgi:acetylornithine deacetylase/succinyl-diaminopimelate desuccinylase-like protein
MNPANHIDQIGPVLQWIDEHREEAIADLQRFCQQPSVAAQDWGMREMADLVVGALQELGAETNLVPTTGYPVVVGQLQGESARHLVIYDHYDVQPPEPLDEWKVPPFGAVINEGILYARGVADNKGNLVARLWAARAWRAVHGTLPCRVTFIFEGEEEVGSTHLGEFAAANQTVVKGDACLWEAGYRDAQGQQTFYAGLKGILYIELRVHGAAYDLHSGNAPLAPNAAWRLHQALGILRAPDGRIRIPHFYDAVQQPTERERELMARFPIDAAALRKQWGVDRLLGPADDPQALTQHLLYEPTCNICGLWSGYSGPGSKTIIPAAAAAKIDFRLVPNQDPTVILGQLRQYLRDQGFDDIDIVELESSEWPAQSPVDTPLMTALVHAARDIYGNEPRVTPRTPGSGPMEHLCQRYGVPAVGGAGVGYYNSRNHAPNENIRLEDYLLGIKHVAATLAEFAAL